MRALSSVKMVNRVKLNTLFNSSASKHYLLLSVLSNVQAGQAFYSSSTSSYPWEAEEVVPGEVDYNQVLHFINRNH